ncbi:FHA domain-containing protein [Desertihabitans brevis]|uniref:FHA domain-containing protein n=1 Tax=Desertihabitans brevis TaxID=2268447 RepID=A0A367YVN5_9ACTN|nr:FHA domain-containing protein [Desertihabitans brevis]RCK69934.1 FHA domain-containing protein [Desertihabitans brevis]
MSIPPSEYVVAWPRIVAVVRPDGTGSLTVNGTERPCGAESVEVLRTGMIARCVAIARSLARPVRFTVTEGEATWTLAVRPTGVVQLLGEDGMVAPSEGLTVHEGRCRSCRRLQPVTETRCPQCGTLEPLRVESGPAEDELGARSASSASSPPRPVPDRPRAEAAAPTATSPSEIEPDSPPPPADRPPRAPIPATPPAASAPGRPGPAGAAPPAGPGPTTRTVRMRISFEHQPPVLLDAPGGVVLGRAPQTRDGRTPVPVVSPRGLVSRTHALLDVDARGRITVTDVGSRNGTGPVGSRTPFPSGQPHEVAPGTRLRLADVVCTVELA